MQKSHKKAFTLADMLTALIITGVLMVLCIPVINYSYEKNTNQMNFSDMIDTANRVLYTYSQQQHTNGSLSQTSLFSSDTVAGNLASIYGTSAKSNCWNGAKIPRNTDGSGDTDDFSNLYCIIDNKNRIYAFETIDSACTEDLRANDTVKTKLQYSCAYMYIDVNGTKAPNVFGRDVFAFVITDNAPNYLYPFGGELLKDDVIPYWKGASPSCNQNDNKDGRSCAGRIIDEGMKIKY